MTVDVAEIARRHEALLTVRKPWDAAWRSLSEHFLPTRFRDNPLDAQRNPVLLNGKIVDSTGVLAMRTLAAGLQGGMTSPARPWFRLTVEDQELGESHGARAYMDAVAERMRNIFHRSNFYNAIHTLYGELGTFGSAFMMEVADFDHGFRFLPFTAGEYVLDLDERQRVDTVFRRFAMSARQLVREFGEPALPDMVLSSLHRPRAGEEQQFAVVHAVYPRHDVKVGKLGHEGMPLVSVYYLDFSLGEGAGSNAKPHLLREGGYETFPGFGPRWSVTGNDVYGKSPAMDVLPDCKMLQQMGVTTLKAIHKAVDPPMSVAAGLKGVGLNLEPSGVNFVSQDVPGQAPQVATPILQIRPEIQAARLAMADVQRQIQQGLYNDLFKMLLDSSRAQITAREVAAREEEKLILIGPVLERLHDELFIPLIDRTFDLMSRLNMLPAVPEELTGQDIKIEFVSLLAQAQKMVSTSAVDQFVGFTMNAAQAFPEILDAVDVDAVADGYGEYLGVAVNMIRPREDREAIRQQRAQAQQQAEAQAQSAAMMQNLGGAAGIAKTLSETSVNGQPAMDAIIGGLGGAI